MDNSSATGATNNADEVLIRLKSARKMEREAKDLFGKYLSAMNENGQNDEDVVTLLEEKIQALKDAEARIEEKTKEIVKYKNEQEELQKTVHNLQGKHDKDKVSGCYNDCVGNSSSVCEFVNRRGTLVIALL